MGTGSWNAGGSRPAHACAWSKIRLDWATPEVISKNQTGVNIPRVEDNPSIIRLWTDGAMGNQYFLVENRQRILFDDNLPGDGLLIYHVDDSVSQQNNPARYKVDVEQADGRSDLNNGLNRGDAGDPWPGSFSKRTFDTNSIPDSKAYSGAETSVSVTGISDSADTMTADFAVEPSWALAYNWLFTDPADLHLFRNYRNRYQARSSKGRLYINLLYRNSDKALEVLRRNPELMMEANYLIEKHKHAVRRALKGKKAVIKNSDEVVAFLDAYAEKAPPGLKALAKIVKLNMLANRRKGKLFLGFRLK
jgi:hypothetical protein